MAIGDIFKLHVRLRVTGGSLTAENSWAFKQTSGLIFATPGEDLTDFFLNDVFDTYKNTYHGNYGLVSLAVETLPAGLIVYELSQPDLSGTLTGDQLPPKNAGVMTIITDHPGRRGKGRTFFPPANEASNGGSGTVGSSYVSAMDAVGDVLLAGASVITHAGWEWGVWSTEDQAFYPAVTYVSRFRWGSQRGRER